MDRKLYDDILTTMMNMRNMEGMRGYYTGKLNKVTLERLILSSDSLIATAKKLKTEYQKELKSMGGIDAE